MRGPLEVLGVQRHSMGGGGEGGTHLPATPHCCVQTEPPPAGVYTLMPRTCDYTCYMAKKGLGRRGLGYSCRRGRYRGAPSGQVSPGGGSGAAGGRQRSPA